MLSNVLHKRERAIDTREPKDSDDNYPEMDDSSFSSGCAEICKKLANFSYSEILTRISDTHALKTLYSDSANGYEKLQLFRLLGLDVENSVIRKFINETYHIENESICQLDPVKFDTIPGYVVEECDKLMSGVQA